MKTVRDALRAPDDLDLAALDHPMTPVLDAKNRASGANVERL